MMATMHLPTDPLAEAPAPSRRKERLRRSPGKVADRSIRIPEQQRKKSLRSSDETTKRKSKKQPVRRESNSNSSRRSTTPAVARSDVRRRPSLSPVRSRCSMSDKPTSEHMSLQRWASGSHQSGSSSPRSVRDQLCSLQPQETPDCCTEQQQTCAQQWLCTCGEDNKGLQQFCGMCGTSRTWQCGLCDFDNKAKFKFCGMCGVPKTVKVETDEEPEQEVVAMAPNEWKCEGCDCINSYPHVFCSMCGSSKVPGEEELLQASFPPPFVTCRPDDNLQESLRSLESWTGESL